MKKNKYSYVGISFVILLFGIWVVYEAQSRYGKDEQGKSQRSVIESKDYELKADEDKSELIKIGEVPEFSFTDQNNEIITNEDYKGKVFVVEFFFTSCPDICIIMNQNMVKIQDEFMGNPNVGMASFTIDPSHDTPEVLKEYAQNMGINKPQWHLLTGDKDAIFKLANEGFKLYVGESQSPEVSFEHSGLFALIDKEGNIRSREDDHGNPLIYYNGLENRDIQMLKEDIRKLL